MDGWKIIPLVTACALFTAGPLVAQNPPNASQPTEAQLPEEGLEGEEAEEIETDRDSFTPALTITPLSRIIVESAYSFIDNDQVPETHSVPELLIRYGYSDWLEFRLGWNYEIGGAGSPVSGNVPSDFDSEPNIAAEHRVLYGVKLWLTEQRGWLPRSVIVIQGFTPTGGESTATEASVTLAGGYVLNNGWVWDSAIRYSTAGHFTPGNPLEEEEEMRDDFGVWAPSTVLKIPLGDRWKIHVEYFGVFSSGRSVETVQHYLSPGAHYLITPDFEIGARLGWGLNDQAANFFVNIGFGWLY